MEAENAEAENAENAGAMRRFRELARVQARGGLEFLSAQERAPDGSTGGAGLILALVIVLLMVTYFYIKVNRRLRARVTYLENRLKAISTGTYKVI